MFFYFCDYFYFSLLTDIAVVVAEWYWKCLFRRYLCQALAAVLALLSVLVVWSELTFFNAQPVLSLFAIFVNLAKEYYDYLSIEVSYSVDSVVLFVLRFNLCFSLCSSCCQSPRSPTCASALIQRCWRFEYLICTTWHHTTKLTNTVSSFPACSSVAWLLPCAWTFLDWFTWIVTLSRLDLWRRITHRWRAKK